MNTRTPSLYRRVRTWTRPWRDRGLVLLSIVWIWVVTRLPVRWGEKMMDWLARGGYYVLRRERTLAIEALTKRFQASPEQARTITRKMFQHFAQSVYELMTLWAFPQHWQLINSDLIGEEYLNQAHDKGRGIILLTAHIGNWELAGACTTKWGFPVNAVARHARQPTFDRLLAQMRHDLGLHVITRSVSMLSMARALKKNEILGILIDLDTKVENAPSARIPVPFFGYPAMTQTGSIRLAKSTGATLLTYFSYRVSPYHHVLEIGTPIELGDEPYSDELAYQALLEYHRRLEVLIRKHPEQWLWIHKRWRSGDQLIEQS